MSYGLATVQAQIVQIASENMAEGARFENPTASETIGPDLPSSFGSQSFTDEPEAWLEPA